MNVRDVGKHPSMHRTAPNAYSAKVEELLCMIDLMWQTCNDHEDKAVRLRMMKLKDRDKTGSL